MRFFVQHCSRNSVYYHYHVQQKNSRRSLCYHYRARKSWVGITSRSPSITHGSSARTFSYVVVMITFIAAASSTTVTSPIQCDTVASTCFWTPFPVKHTSDKVQNLVILVTFGHFRWFCAYLFRLCANCRLFHRFYRNILRFSVFYRLIDKFSFCVDHATESSIASTKKSSNSVSILGWSLCSALMLCSCRLYDLSPRHFRTKFTPLPIFSITWAISCKIKTGMMDSSRLYIEELQVVVIVVHNC
jgi:hypothetical protein